VKLLRCLPFALLIGNALAQDLMQVSPAVAKVEYEDANIRVIRSHYEPSSSSAMHSHPPRVVIAVQSGTLRLSKPDGSSVVAAVDPQQPPLAFGPQTHAVANIGNTPVETIEIEFKRQEQLGTLQAAPDDSAADPEGILREPHHHWVMQTPYFRVVDARIPPGETTQWHRHEFRSVGVRIQGSRISTQKSGGEWSSPENMPSGAVTIEKDPWPYVHRVKNSGDDEYHVILVELVDSPGTQGRTMR
jgi:quercetin dioxygenase-like cupin family protein